MPSSPRAPSLVIQPNLTPRGVNPPAVTASSHGNVPSRAGLTNIIIPAAPASGQATRLGLWHTVQVLLGHAGGSEVERAERRQQVRVVCAFAVAAVQLTFTVVVTEHSVKHRVTAGPYAGQTDFEICKRLGIMNFVWFLPTILACGLYMSPHTHEIGDVTWICPLDTLGAHVLVRRFVLPPATVLLYCVSVGFLATRVRACFQHAPYITALAVTILIVVALLGLKILLGCCVGVDRRATGAGHLTQAEVNRIRLVHYIPSPPDDAVSPTTPTERSPHSPYSPHSPNSPTSPRTLRSFTYVRKKVHRFILFRSHSSRGEPDLERGAVDPNTSEMWEATREPAALPYVLLEDNLAVCSICMEDFEAPPKAVEPSASMDLESGEGGREAHEMRSANEVKVAVEPEAGVDGTDARLERGGRVLMPLRLLSCGHAFHKECIDPWLTGHATSCPNCKVPVQVPPPATKKWGSWRRGAV